MGKGVPKGSIWVGNNGRSVPSPMFIGKDVNETLGGFLVHVHAFCVVFLVRLPYLTDDSVGDSGAVIVVRWRISSIRWWSWVAVGYIAGVVLPHVVWDYQ